MSKRPKPLPYDVDDGADIAIFIEEWRAVVMRQMDRLEQGHWSDAYLLILAAHHVQMACNAYAVHDPSGEIERLCAAFVAEHAQLATIRNAIVHFDEYYRGQGRAAQGRRVFRHVYGKGSGNWHLVLGPLFDCDVSRLGCDAVSLADDVLNAKGPVDAWVVQMTTNTTGNSTSRNYQLNAPSTVESTHDGGSQ